MCVSEFALFCKNIFYFEYNFFNFLLICNIYLFPIFHLLFVRSSFKTFLGYATCQWFSRVSTICMTQEKRQVKRETVFCLFDIPMHKHANYSYKNYVIYNLLWEPKTAEHIEIRIFVFDIWIKNYWISRFFLFFHYLHSCGFVKFPRSIYNLEL